jgi:hypothetical protein
VCCLISSRFTDLSGIEEYTSLWVKINLNLN